MKIYGSNIYEYYPESIPKIKLIFGVSFASIFALPSYYYFFYIINIKLKK